MLTGLVRMACAQESWTAAYDSANARYERGQVGEAYLEASRCLEIYRASGGPADSNYASILRILGLTCYSLGRLDEGVEAIGREIQIRSSKQDEYLAGAHLLRGQTLRASSKFREASADFETAVGILEKTTGQEETLTDARMELAGAWYLAAEQGRALELFQRVIPGVTVLNESVIQGFYYYGMLMIEAGRAVECIPPIERIRSSAQDSDLSKSEDFVILLGTLGDAYSSVARFQEAVTVYRQALSSFRASGSRATGVTDGIYAGLSAASIRSGDLAQARTALKQIEAGNGSRQAVAAGYARMAAARLEQRQLDSAVYFLEYALRMLDAARPEYQALIADITRNLAQAETERRHDAAAARWLDQSLAAARKANRPALILMALNRISLNRIRSGQMASAETSAREAFRLIRQSTVAPAEKAQALAHMGWVHHYYSASARSDSAFGAAVGLLAAEKSISPQLNANIRGQYANCLQQRGDNPASLREFTAARSAVTRFRPSDPVAWGVTTGSMADLNVRMGRMGTAQTLLDSALQQVRPTADRHPAEYAALLLTQARIHQATGAYTKAEQTGTQVIELLRSGKTNDPLLTVLALDQQANAYKAMGNFAAAEPLLNSAMQELEKSGLTGSTQYTTILQNLATLYQLQEKFDKAERLLNLVVEQDRKTLGTGHPQYAVTLQNLAALYQRRGNREQAVRLLEESRGIIGKTLGKENRTYSTLLGNLAALYQDMGRYSEAETMWKQCLELRSALFGKDHPDYFRALYGLANFYFATADMAKAGPYFEEVVTGYRKQVNTFFNAMSDQEKGAFYARVRPVFEAYMDYAVQAHAKATDPLALEKLYDLQLSTKAILLTASNRVREAIMAGGNQELKALYQAWQQKKEDIVHFYSAGKAERARLGIDLAKLESEANDLEKKLSVMSADFGQQAAGRTTTWRDVQAVLKPGEAALEYIRIRKKFRNDSVYYAALVLRPDSKAPELAILPNGLALENKWFRYHRNAVTHLFNDTLTIRQVWYPLAKRLTGVQRIYVSSDGVMNKINLSGLYDSHAKAYLVDQLDIRLVSNTSELVSRSAGNPVRDARVFGYPDFNLNDHREVPSGGLRNTGGLLPGMSITDLPATQTELKTVTSILSSGQWKVAAFASREASEENIKKVRAPGILHVATHGFFQSDVAVNEAGAESEREETLQNPLFRSGLLLAGAGVPAASRTEDGVLTAYEAMNLDLQNTELVCLSACETGLGDVQNGEGVYGLQRSFLVAGARSLLMSLWQVDDEATQQLMTTFYQGWMSGMSKGEAFRKAQQQMKEKYKQPFYWAAFVLVGS